MSVPPLCGAQSQRFWWQCVASGLTTFPDVVFFSTDAPFEFCFERAPDLPCWLFDVGISASDGTLSVSDGFSTDVACATKDATAVSDDVVLVSVAFLLGLSSRRR